MTVLALQALTLGADMILFPPWFEALLVGGEVLGAGIVVGAVLIGASKAAVRALARPEQR
jgi:hypothetical protein